MVFDPLLVLVSQRELCREDEHDFFQRFLQAATPEDASSAMCGNPGNFREGISSQTEHSENVGVDEDVGEDDVVGTEMLEGEKGALKRRRTHKGSTNFATAWNDTDGSWNKIKYPKNPDGGPTAGTNFIQ